MYEFNDDMRLWQNAVGIWTSIDPSSTRDKCNPEKARTKIIYSNANIQNYSNVSIDMYICMFGCYLLRGQRRLCPVGSEWCFSYIVSQFRVMSPGPLRLHYVDMPQAQYWLCYQTCIDIKHQFLMYTPTQPHIVISNIQRYLTAMQSGM
jgi:hypothetical protein